MKRKRYYAHQQKEDLRRDIAVLREKLRKMPLPQVGKEDFYDVISKRDTIEVKLSTAKQKLKNLKIGAPMLGDSIEASTKHK